MKKMMKKMAAGLVVAVALMASGAGAFVQAQVPAKPDLIEVITIDGEINRSTASAVSEAVDKINENPKVKAVLLVVDTPGGGASASAVLYQALAKIKVPVVAYCEYLCASGGVYAAMAPSVKYIAVRDDTIGGSVGVIMHMQRFNRLLDWAKIDSETFKSGPLKDAGNPTRAGSDEERKYLQSIVDTLAEKFYGVVTKARAGKVPHLALAEIKTAKIFIGADIVRVGLADSVMSREEALQKAKDLSGSKNAFSREELAKVVKNASEAAAMKPVTPPVDFIDRGFKHIDTVMEIVDEVRAGESVKFLYRMPYQF